MFKAVRTIGIACLGENTIIKLNDNVWRLHEQAHRTRLDCATGEGKNSSERHDPLIQVFTPS